ncbi:MAG TPA: signal recognition particle protein [Candidatus Dormibacteraeota bacterium]|jgi:signal recognition particle subunit SRP54|nr:signal recognition particle protein [Candidatus Dormibacteraeota bacterium]
MFESLTDRLGAVLKRLGGRGVLRPEEVEASLREVRMALLEADVNFKVVKHFTEQVRQRLVGAQVAEHLTPPQQVIKAVNEELVELLGGNQQGLRYAPSPPTVLMLVGLNGAGKTTMAIKLALHARHDGHRPMVVALDLRRPAAVDQLRILAEREKVAFFSGQGTVEDLARQSLEAAARESCDVVILDTAGRLSVDEELMEEMRRLREAVPVTEALFVADAMTGQEAVNVGQAFHDRIGVDGVVLTKLDADSRGGAALSLKVATGQTVRFAGVGEKPGDLEVFHADRMASRILGMGDVLTLIEKAERELDQDAAQRMERSMREGHLSFDDFLEQLRQVRKLGSVDSILDMVPGAGRLKGQVQGDPEQEMRRMEAIILSMTKQERNRPEIINGRRRRRIAAGSGTHVSDVNKLLKAREQMQQLVKQFGGGAMGSGRRGLPGGLSRLFGA